MMKVAVESYWGLVASGEGGSGGGCCSSEVDVEGYQGYLGRGRSRRRRRSAEWGLDMTMGVQVEKE